MHTQIRNTTAISERIVLIEPYSTLNYTRVNRQKLGFKNVRQMEFFLIKRALAKIHAPPGEKLNWVQIVT